MSARGLQILDPRADLLDNLNQIELEQSRRIGESMGVALMKSKSAIGLSRAVKAVRVFHRVSQKDLAKELGLPSSYISEVENGKRAVTLKLVDKYAAYFNMVPSEILYLGENYDNDAIKNSKIGSKVLKVLDWIIDDHIGERSHASSDEDASDKRREGAVISGRNDPVLDNLC